MPSSCSAFTSAGRPWQSHPNRRSTRRPLHRLIARDRVLDEAGQQVAVVRQSVGERGAVVEHELVVAVRRRRRAARPNVRTSTPSPKWPGSSSSRAGKFGFGSTAGYGTPRCYRRGSRPPMAVQRRVGRQRVAVSSNVKRKSSCAFVGGRRVVEPMNPAPTGVGSSPRRRPSEPRRSSRRSTRRSPASRRGRSTRSIACPSIVVVRRRPVPRRRIGRPGVCRTMSPSARCVVGCRQQRAPDVAEPGRYPVGDLDQFGRRVADAAALGDEELLEVVHVGFEEIAPGLERVDLAGHGSRSVSPARRASSRASSSIAAAISRVESRVVAASSFAVDDQLGRFGPRLGDQ